ncbi:adenine phosphoribosyltransferase [Amylibacter marinus]|uniref:Adenine phosphoribosyltransferase n=1 Tax=Amylibacter marinus TaxID=1475483 RepID=A0ABQ5VUQ0_9RHOB|nr:adenine phosphoribosyltransferase [Amylibacter marinus]GLQ34911.1 adenine phosphoribosyltransferase [Amylibacter marinus]
MTVDLRDFIRTIPDFPHEGIMFRDVTTLFNDPVGLRETVDQMAAALGDQKFDKIAGLEARGFMLGAALAYKLGIGFTMIRKAGKLPGSTISEDYALEYGQATVEIHDDALDAGDKVLLFDDLIATGGTAEAGIKLIERLGAEVTLAAFIIDLPDLGGRAKIEKMGVKTHVLCAFDGL